MADNGRFGLAAIQAAAVPFDREASAEKGLSPDPQGGRGDFWRGRCNLARPSPEVRLVRSGSLMAVLPRRGQ
jgi:hypothetical protein